MRRRDVRAKGLALALGLCAMAALPGLGTAQGEGSWFARMFGRGEPTKQDESDKAVPAKAAPAKGSPAKGADEKVVVPAGTSGQLRTQARGDYLRRLEACDKLRE